MQHQVPICLSWGIPWGKRRVDAREFIHIKTSARHPPPSSVIWPSTIDQPWRRIGANETQTMAMDRQDKGSKKTDSIAEEEAKLLESLGLLHLVQESQNKNDTVEIKTKEANDVSSSSSPTIIEPVDGKSSFWKTNTLIPSSSTGNKILLGIGGTLFLLPHLAIILSLPPVLQRRGAPYLPTFSNKLNVMFDLIKQHANKNNNVNNSKTLLKQQSSSSLKFVDLGSGDGRIVFRAAREGIFQKSVGYEINPALHLIVKLRQLLTPKYWSTTEFHLGDLWKIRELHKYDVVAVYGLYPIMDRLGKKLQEELKPGALVVSNVFEIPGWRASTTSSGGGGSGGKGVYLYQVPECFRHHGNLGKNGTQDVYSNDDKSKK